MKGWLDNFGKADNANDSNVSLPEGFVGVGYDTKGRNYSPAWGGQFQDGGELIPVSPAQQIAKGVQPVPTVPYLQTKDPVEFYKSWIQSPEYARRQLATGYVASPEDQSLLVPSAQKSRETRLSSLENISPVTYSGREASKATPGLYGSPSYVNINPADYVGTSRESILAHELAHIAGATVPEGTTRPGIMSAKEQEIFKKSMLPMKEPVLSGVQGSKEREASKRALEDFIHSQKPQEAKADLDALRFMMYDKGIYDITKGKKFTESDFEKAKQSLGKDRVFKRLADRVGKKNFVNLMNTIALADQEETPVAMGGMSIPGSVGFTYARTAGSAPSNGPYAKKTKASAQIGKNVKKDETNVDTGIANKIAGLELQQNPEYQYWKYRQSLPQLRQAPGRGEELVREGLATADIATDLMQIGNFIPHPMAQGVGKAGNILGSGVDLAQALMSARQGDYLDAAINVGSVGLAGGLAGSTFRRNSKYLQPGQPLYALSPQAFGSLSRTNYIEPFRKVGKMTDKNLLANRALLGLVGAETVYDAIPQKEYGGEIPSAQSGIMTPMLLGRKILSYLYPSEEDASTVAAAPVEYKKGLTDELLKRQAYKESTFNPAAVSPAGYKGLTQIGEEVISDYSKKKGGKKLDPFNPKDAVELQKFAMDDLYNASFINKPNQSDSVRIAKTLAAYNWGRGNLFNYLNEQKQKGVDIYGSYDWLNDLPKETSDYVNKILLQEDQSFNKNYKRDSTNPKYKDVTSLYDKKKFGGKVTTAQNGQEMKFYQNGLDWKPKSMQNGGEEDINTINLPEVVVTPYDEEYPFYQSLSDEQKKYINDKGPIGRATRAIAKTGKKGKTAKDISKVVRDVQQTGAEFTGIPGTIRFSEDPVGKLTGTGKTLLDLGLTASPLAISLGGVNPITGQQMFNEQNLQGAFDTLDALGMATGAMTVLKQPVQQALKTSGKFLTTQTPLRNTYKINPFAVKEPDVILTRAQKPGQTDELRRLAELESKKASGNLDFMERYEYNQILNSRVSQPGYGRWFGSDPSQLGYYTSPNIQDRRGYEGFSEILKLRLPGKEAKNFNVGTNPVEGAFPSYAPSKEFILPQDLVFSSESFIPNAPYGKPGSLDNFIRTVDAEQRIANTPDWLRGYPSVANKPSGSDAINNIGEASLTSIPKESIKSSVIDTKNNLSRAIKGTGSFIDQVKGEILQGEANRKSIKIGNEWLQNWIDNPATRQKIDADIDRAIALKGPDATIDDLNYLELVRNQSKDFVPNSKEYSLYNQLNDNLDQYLRLSNTKLKPIHGKNMGISLMHSVDPQTRELIAKGLVPADEKYGSFISRNTSIPQVERQYTAIHEGTHDWLPEEVVKKLGMRNIALKNINPEAKQYLLDIEAGLKDQLTDEQKYLGYLADPTEQHARIMELRANLGLKPEDVVDENLAKEIIKKIENRETPVDRRFLKVIDSNPLKLAERFNRFWAVPAVGAVVGSQAVDQQKNGGSVKNNKNPMQRFQEGGQLNFNPLTNEYELPEFVVEGKDERIKNAMSQGMANFYGHVGELMGAPQKEMMQLITGKEQTPSQAFGFQNTGGWLDSPTSFGKNLLNTGLDFGLDPLNAVGVGLADDVFKLGIKNVGKNLTENLGKGIGSRAISQAPSPQMMVDNIAASATPNASTVSSQPLPYRELDHPHMDLLQELKQKTIDRIDTPEGRRRLQYMINKNFGRDHESWGKPVEGWGEFFLHGLKSGELSGFKKLTPDDIIEEIKNLKFVKSMDPWLIGPNNAHAGRIRGNEGFYGPGSFPIMYMGENQIPGDILRIFDHEMGHIFQRNRKSTNLDDKLSKLELKTQPSLYPDSPISEGQLEDVDFSKSNQEWGYGFYPARDYFLTGSAGMEKLPFAAEIRQSLLRRGKIKNYYDEITPQMIEDHYDLYNKTGGNKSILRLYEIMEKTPKNFQILSETLNKLPAVTLPIAGGAAATISALQNQQPVQKQKNGGITKDNLGYWNPDNWGKPVEIDSNNITMEGVYEPLLGISDTGDTKLMKPGKNYKFKGKKVTEFPVAELGINQLDAQPMKKLNQLLNFTNNPDKDNWLDKYN